MRYPHTIALWLFLMFVNESNSYSNGKIQKYSLVNTHTKSHSDGTAMCQTLYGTTLASIHTDRDNAEIRHLLSIHPQTAWIGLTHGVDATDPMTYSWSDGTDFDFGRDVSCSGSSNGCDPWISTGSDNATDNEICIVVRGMTGEWDHQPCDTLYAFICQLPSELTLNTWTASYGGWNYDADHMEFVHNGQFTEMIMLDTQWSNGDAPLQIDYTFSVDFKTRRKAYPGLFLFNGRSSSYCEYYGMYLGLESGRYYVVIDGNKYDKTSAQWKYEVYVVRELQFTIVNGQYYTMSIVITNGNTFDIFVNDGLYVSYTDDPTYSTVDNGYSGYIGFYAYDIIEVKAKYLYVSGTPKTVQAFDASPSNCVTASPTLFPTLIPTSKPTKKPSVNPTKYPTPHPTKPPTFISNDPTQTPSVIVPPTVDTAPPSVPFVTNNPTGRPSSLLNAPYATFGEAEIGTGSSTEGVDSNKRNSLKENKAWADWMYMSFIIGCTCFVFLCVFCVMYSVAQKTKSGNIEIGDVSNVGMVAKYGNESNTAGYKANSNAIAHAPNILNVKDSDETDPERDIVKSWFEDVVRLPIYFDIFMQSEYNTMQCMKQIDNDLQLKDIGIYNTSHQEQILSAIAGLRKGKCADDDGAITSGACADDMVMNRVAVPSTFVNKTGEQDDENTSIVEAPAFITARHSFEVLSDSDREIETGGKL